MTNILEKASSDLRAVLTAPAPRKIPALAAVPNGGYSVWDCPPLPGSASSPAAKKTPPPLTDW